MRTQEAAKISEPETLRHDGRLDVPPVHYEEGRPDREAGSAKDVAQYFYETHSAYGGRYLLPTTSTRSMIGRVATGPRWSDFRRGGRDNH